MKKKINFTKKKKIILRGYDSILEQRINESSILHKNFYLNFLDENQQTNKPTNQQTNNSKKIGIYGKCIIDKKEDIDIVLKNYEKDFFSKNKNIFYDKLSVLDNSIEDSTIMLEKKINFNDSFDNSANNSNKNLRFFLKKSFISFFYKNNFSFFLEKRFEFSLLCNFNLFKNLNVNKSKIIKIFLKERVSFFFFLRKGYISFLKYISFLFTYKSWRHYKGYPVNGQRTWSNGNTAFRCNVELKRIKLKIFIKNNKNTMKCNDDLLNVFFLAENVNNFYKLQCYQEWMKSKKINKKMISKRNIFKIDINLLARGEVQSLTKSKIRKRSKKKKLAAVGFKVGFTKIILESYNKLTERRKKNTEVNKYLKGMNKKYKDKKNRSNIRDNIKIIKSTIKKKK